MERPKRAEKLLGGEVCLLRSWATLKSHLNPALGPEREMSGYLLGLRNRSQRISTAHLSRLLAGLPSALLQSLPHDVATSAEPHHVGAVEKNTLLPPVYPQHLQPTRKSPEGQREQRKCSHKAGLQTERFQESETKKHQPSTWVFLVFLILKTTSLSLSGRGTLLSVFHQRNFTS